MWSLNAIEELLAKRSEAGRKADGPSHKHACMNCGTIWEHPDNTVNLSHDEFIAAHDCPKCGEHQTYKDTPLNRWCGIDPTLPKETRTKAVKLAEQGVPPQIARDILGLH